MIARFGALSFAALLLAATSASAQTPQKDPAACDQAAATQPATPPSQGSDSGTKPGNAGSTGWSGGTGGSYIGTTPAGATPDSPNAHAATATGLDPTSPDQPKAKPGC